MPRSTVTETGKAGRKQYGREIPQPKIWYVSFETYRTRRHFRNSSAFESESEAKQFAREALAAGNAVYAGTINPHTPKRFVSPENMRDWVDAVEPSSKGNSASGTAMIERGDVAVADRLNLDHRLNLDQCAAPKTRHPHKSIAERS
jgi:hypothetical protein